MTWQYTIEWHQPRDVSDAQKGDASNKQRKNIVTVTSKPRSQMESSLITVTTWTSNSIVNATLRSEESDAKNVTMTTTADREFEPLSVFAQVLRGGSPVLGARVLMTVEIEQANGSVHTLSPVPLSDDGFGGKNSHLESVCEKEKESVCVCVCV